MFSVSTFEKTIQAKMWLIACNVARCKPTEKVEIEYPVFLRMDSADYVALISASKDLKKLKKLKRKSKKSHEDIRRHLITVNPDFDELICLAYLVAILNGDKCPSRQLYDILFAFLSD